MCDVSLGRHVGEWVLGGWLGEGVGFSLVLQSTTSIYIYTWYLVYITVKLLLILVLDRQTKNTPVPVSKVKYFREKILQVLRRILAVFRVDVFWCSVLLRILSDSPCYGVRYCC